VGGTEGVTIGCCEGDFVGVVEGWIEGLSVG
jgi:hypothetical protein